MEKKMKKNIVVLVGAFMIIFLLSGCATISETTSINRDNFLKLNVGMSKQEAMNIMGAKPMTAYYKPGTYGKTVSVIINNPYRSEILKGKGDKIIGVLYYVTDDKNNDGAISDNETMPLVFEESKLMGWGWNSLEYSIKKYEIVIKKGDQE